MKNIRLLPAVGQRVETGPVRFGDDWPGTFIRGDSALGYAMYLEIVLAESKADPLTVAVLKGLLADLRESNLMLHCNAPPRRMR
jgi:hypothetical protein